MILVVLAAVLLWLLLSFVFIPVGKLIYRLVKDAKDAMSEEDKEEEKE